MNATQAGTGEIDRYLDGVRAALADLPDEAREELLEDLSAHLAEVAAESGGEPLERRLGTPAAYAAELRAAAGYEAAGGTRRYKARPGLVRARAVAGTLNVSIGKLLGYRTLAEFVRLLRPAWWVLRGYAVGMLVVNLLLVADRRVVPRLDSTLLVTVAVLALAIGGSVRLGRISPAGRRRFALYAANVVAALLVLGGVAHAAADADSSGYGPVASYDPYGAVTDVYPYDSNGEPLSGVVLYDQNGQPLRIGDPSRCMDGPPAYEDRYRYPLCPLGPGVRRAPGGSVSPSGSSGPSGLPSPSGSPSAGGSGAPPPSPSASR